LATFVLEKLVIRSDRYGRYYDTKDKAHKARGYLSKTPLTHEVLVRHFQATASRDIAGIFAADDGAGDSKFLVLDLDAHAEAGRAELLAKYRESAGKVAEVLKARFQADCLIDESPHGMKIWIYFEAPHPVVKINAVGEALARAAGLDPDQIEIYPDIRDAGATPQWIRLPGRHHNTGRWSVLCRAGGPVPDGQWVSAVLAWGPASAEVIESLAGHVSSPVQVEEAAAQTADRELRDIVIEGVPEGRRHVSLVKVAACARNFGLDERDLLVLLTAANSRFGPPLDSDEVERIASDFASKPIGKRRAARDGGPEYSAWFPNLIDVVELDGRPKFLTVLSDGSFDVADEAVRSDGVVVAPPPSGELPYPLPNADRLQVYLTEPEPGDRLFEDLRRYFLDAVELPCETTATVLAAWVLLTYRQEHLAHFPIIYLYGPPERGKSRVGKLLTFAAMRGIVDASVREANLFRYSHDIHATVFLDLTDAWKVIQKAAAEDIILHSFERGGTVSRVLKPDAGAFKDTKRYDVFGPRILASNRDVPEALASRTLAIRMPEAVRHNFPPVDRQAALLLSERCLAWRAHNLHRELPDAPPAARGRLGDITAPLLALVHDVAPEREDELRGWIAELESQRRVQRGESLEGRIVAVLARMIREGTKRIFVKDLVRLLQGDDTPILDSYRSPNQGVGYALDRLGIQRKRHRAGMYVDPTTIDLPPLAAKYGVDLSATELESENYPFSVEDITGSPSVGEDPSELFTDPSPESSRTTGPDPGANDTDGQRSVKTMKTSSRALDDTEEPCNRDPADELAG